MPKAEALPCYRVVRHGDQQYYRPARLPLRTTRLIRGALPRPGPRRRASRVPFVSLSARCAVYPAETSRTCTSLRRGLLTPRLGRRPVGRRPGYAVMRSLMMGFRALLKPSAPTTTPRTPPRTVAALHQWMARAGERHCHGPALRVPIAGRYSRRGGGRHRALEQRPRRRAGGSTEDLQRQMYGRAGVELLRARLIPLS
jgi:hypothetical protein